MTGEAKRGFTREDIQARARRVLDLAVRQGTTAMRSHAEVDPIVGLMGFEALAALKREYAPPRSISSSAPSPRTASCKPPAPRRSCARPCGRARTWWGGVPYNDTDARRHIDIVLDLAVEFGVDADFHTDFFDEPQHLHARYIAAETVRRGWQGRVALGHLREMAALPLDEQDALARTLAQAGIAVIVLPATDLYRMGRKDVRSPRRGLAPVKRGRARPSPGARDAHHTPGADSRAARPRAPRRRSGRSVIWDTDRPDGILTAPCRLAVKGGRVSVEHSRSLVEPWRESRSERSPAL